MTFTGKRLADRPQVKGIVAYLARAIPAIVILYIAAKAAPNLPPIMLALLMIVYAALSTVGALYFTVIKRLHRQYKLNEGGKLSRLNHKWLVTLIVLFIFALASALFFVLESPKWDALDWLLIFVAPFLYYFIFLGSLKFFEKEYAPRFDRAEAMKVSFWIMIVLLCVAYILLSTFTQNTVDGLTLSAALDSIPQPYKYSPSALMVDLDALSHLANGITAFGQTLISNTSFLIAIICRFAFYAAIVLGLMNLFRSSLLSPQEIKEEFQVLDTNKSNDHSRPILKRYIVALTLISLIFTVSFVALNSEAERVKESAEMTGIESFVDNATKHLVYIADEEYMLYWEFNDLKKRYDQESEKVIGEKKKVLEPLINDYYSRCQKNVDSYLDWRENPVLSALNRLLGEKAIKDEFKKQITRDVSDSMLIEQYNTLQDQLSNLRSGLLAELKNNHPDAPPDAIKDFEVLLDSNSENRLELWSVLGESAADATVTKVLVNPKEGITRDELRDEINGLIDEARTRAYKTIDVVK